MLQIKAKVCPACQQEFRPRRERVVCCSKRCAACLVRGIPPEQAVQRRPGGMCNHCERTVGKLASRGLCYPCSRNTGIRVTSAGPDKRGPKATERPRGTLTDAEIENRLTEFAWLPQAVCRRFGVRDDEYEQLLLIELWAILRWWMPDIHPELRAFLYSRLKWKLLRLLRPRGYMPNFNLLYREFCGRTRGARRGRAS